MSHASDDQKLESLGFPAQFLLWAMRTWVRAALDRQPLPEHLSTALRLAGAADALGELDAALSLVAAAATRPLDLRCPRCPYVSADESGLLSVAQALQAGEPSLARTRLETLLPPSAARLVLLPFARLCGRLRAAGLKLQPMPLPPASAEASEPSPNDGRVLSFPDRGLHLLQ